MFENDVGERFAALPRNPRDDNGEIRRIRISEIRMIRISDIRGEIRIQ